MNKYLKVGIDKISLHVPRFYVDLVELAEKRNVDPNKWTLGIGQNRMAVNEANEDIVTMAANAAYKILTEDDKKEITQVIFATESGIDYSKAASTYIHELLDINKYAKSYEVKQACYSATAAIQIAKDHVSLRPEEKVLVVSADIAKYGPETGGEVTQGAGAIAMLISANPSILELSKDSLSTTVNSYDFWRPTYSEVPMVDGKFSTEIYIAIFIDLIEKYKEKYQGDLDRVENMLFHLPFSKMGKKALQSYQTYLADTEKSTEDVDQWLENYETSTKLTKEIGNLYTGSLYLSLLSQLIYGDLEEGEEIALFSYGSGSVAEIFTGKIVAGFKNILNENEVINALDQRQALDLDSYDNEYFKPTYTERQDKIFDSNGAKGFVLEKIEDDKRYYKFV